jgi:hypothetical protein
MVLNSERYTNRSILTSMKRVTQLTLALAIIACGCSRKSDETESTKMQLAAIKNELSANKENSKLLEEKLGQMTKTLLAVSEQLNAANGKILDYESKGSTPPPNTTSKLSVPSAINRPDSEGNAHYIFPALVSLDGRVIGENMEYSSTLGRSLVFKDASGQRKRFDVDQLHPELLAQIGIDASSAKQKQVELDARNKAIDEVNQQGAALRIQARMVGIQQQQVMQAQIDIENAKIAEQRRQAMVNEQVQAAQLENQRLSVQAQLRAADAAMQQALNPATTIIQQNQAVRIR